MTAPIGKSARSEAVFGSAARGDFDTLSDRDYLIVDDEAATLSRRESELREQGWSVASYTFKKLAYLAAKGALFVQHIKLESKIMTDSDGRLENLLRNFQPKLSYSDELKANAQLAAVVSERPNTPEGALWAADVLYVTLRNFGILAGAEVGNYAFSYQEVVDWLIHSGAVDLHARSPLMKLRLMKALYRSGEKVPSLQIDEALNSVFAHLPERWFPAQSKSLAPTQILQSAMPAPSGSSAYERLRRIEKYFIAAISVSPSFRSSEEALNLKAWIENPRAYAFIAGKMEIEHLRLLKSLLDSRLLKTAMGLR